MICFSSSKNEKKMRKTVYSIPHIENYILLKRNKKASGVDCIIGIMFVALFLIN
jgi:hypothetical protein